MISFDNIVNVAVLIFTVENITYDIVLSAKGNTPYYFRNETLSDKAAIPIVKKSYKHYFAKCCPPGYIYEVYDRKCVQTNDSLSIYEELNLNVTIIKHSLSDCVVLVDQIIKNISVIPHSTNALILGDEVFSAGKYCLDKIYNSENYVARICHEKEYCLQGNDNGKKPWCLKKCCPDGQAFSVDNCYIHTEFGVNVSGNPDILKKTDNYALFNHVGDCVRILGEKSRDNYTITAYGSLILKEAGAWKEYNVSEFKYCIDYDLIDGKANQFFLLCATSSKNDIKFLLSKPALLLSCVCLLLTAIIYTYAHKLRKTIHKITFCYCIFQTIAFALLVTIQFQPGLKQHCKSLGFACYYSFLATFSWFNVMCYDIWQNVGRITARVQQTKVEAVKKVLYYTCYGLIIPLIFTLLFYMANERIYHVPASIYPYIGDTVCLIENGLEGNNYGHTVYFVLPTGILIFINLLFFVKTIWHFIQVKRHLKNVCNTDISESSRRGRINYKRFIMILKLTLLMGITWIFEVVSSLIEFREHQITKYIELVVDTFNCLQGVFIFFILVVKWKHIKLKLVQLLKANEGTSESTTTSTKTISSNAALELSHI